MIEMGAVALLAQLQIVSTTLVGDRISYLNYMLNTRCRFPYLYW